MKYLFLISSHAGNKNFKKLEENIKKVYQLKNIRHEIIKTNHKNHAREIVHQFKDCEDLVMYICSGDGTVNEVVNEMMNTNAKFNIGLIPSGTANDFSKNFDYTNFSIENTIEPEISKLDLIKVNDRYSINVLSFGFDTIILNSAYEIIKKHPNIGNKAYILSVIKNIFNIPSYKLNVTLDNDKYSDSFILGSICNGGYYGNGFNPSPNAILDDGIIEVCLAKNIKFFELVPLILKYKKGEHTKNKNIIFKSIKSGKIISDKEFLANVDGEIFKTNKLEFEVLPQSISFANITRKDY